MKKFLAVLDGLRLAKATIDYAIKLAKLEEAHLVGVFLDEPTYRSYDIYKVIMGGRDVDLTIRSLDKLDQQKRDDAVRKFQSACEKAGVSFSIHRDRHTALKAIREESIFADLLIIGKQESFTYVKEKLPSSFLQNLLAGSLCPVLVVPPKFNWVDGVFLLYDGQPSSVYAAKMFRYLLPNLSSSPELEVVNVRPEGATTHLPNNKLMREYIKRHFPQAVYTVLRGDAEVQLKGHIRNHAGNELLVVGAYRRSDLSRWFKSSMADILLRDLNNPLLIAHH
jgi:nucleotide-binding universal stress UspA family protein